MQEVAHLTVVNPDTASKATPKNIEKDTKENTYCSDVVKGARRKGAGSTLLDHLPRRKGAAERQEVRY